MISRQAAATRSLAAVSRVFRCGHCGAAIDLADTNVATDIALCRACGQTMPFSSVAEQSELEEVDLAAPPKGVSVGGDAIGGIVIGYHRFSRVLFFLIPFTVLWSGGSLAAIYGSQIAKGSFDRGASLAGLPFLVGTAVLLTVITFLAFGRRRIAVGRGQCEVFMGIGPFGWRRGIPLASGTTLRLEPSSVTINKVRQRDVVVTTGERTLKFGATLPEEARVFIAAVLQKALPNA